MDEKNKQVVFHLKGAYPATMAMTTWMMSFPNDYKGVVIRCEETFYKLRTKVNESLY
tara:strand:- start:181 stop:351 length:171 start_codon:yes stop_codon:yes gene_type:complete